jgi:hypothetical protein
MEALCLDDLDMFGGELDDPLEELAQDLYHRIVEAPGSNLDDPARGYGLHGRLSGAGRSADLMLGIQQGLEAEVSKDDRVLQARAYVTSPSVGVYEARLEIVADEGALAITLVSDGSGVRRVV